jgi:hypothetical protein
MEVHGSRQILPRPQEIQVPVLWDFQLKSIRYHQLPDLLIVQDMHAGKEVILLVKE